MNEGILQYWLDQLALTSLQRWALMAVAVLSMLSASAAAMVVGGQMQLAVAAPIAMFSISAALRTDSHTALAAELLLLWQWFISVEDATTPWAIAVAACVLVFHTTIALMSVTPISAKVDGDVWRAWVARGLLLMVATIGVWVLVVLFDESDTGNDVPLTMAALAVLSALALAGRWRLTEPRRAQSDRSRATGWHRGGR